MNGTDSFICALRGPIVLMTVGALFALNNFTPYKFHQTWPVLLIVFGVLSLARRGAVHGAPGPAPLPPPGQPPAPRPSWIQPPPPGTGSYRGSNYGDNPVKPPDAGGPK